MKKVIILILFGVTTSACVSPYQVYNQNSKKPLGYRDIKLDSKENKIRYFITYHGDGTKEQNYQFWLQRASELCPKGYTIETHNTDIFYGSIRSPVNGMMVTLGTQQPIDKGIVECVSNG